MLSSPLVVAGISLGIAVPMTALITAIITVFITRLCCYHTTNGDTTDNNKSIGDSHTSTITGNNKYISSHSTSIITDPNNRNSRPHEYEIPVVYCARTSDLIDNEAYALASHFGSLPTDTAITDDQRYAALCNR